MSGASSFLSALEGQVLSDDDIRSFADLLERETSRSARRSAVEKFLRVADVSHEQVALLARTRPVNDSVDLLLLVRRHLGTMSYRESEREDADESIWVKVLGGLGDSAAIVLVAALIVLLVLALIGQAS